MEFLRSLHVVSVPTVYCEAKGLYVLEAMAQGVPVVQPRHGSFPELIEATGGGLLFEPGVASALAEPLACLMDDAVLRRHLGAQGQARVRESFNSHVMAEQTWEVCRRYCRH
jgi:glycosyltransferase involved in cell wall biosynthesis